MMVSAVERIPAIKLNSAWMVHIVIPSLEQPLPEQRKDGVPAPWLRRQISQAFDKDKHPHVKRAGRDRRRNSRCLRGTVAYDDGHLKVPSASSVYSQLSETHLPKTLWRLGIP